MKRLLYFELRKILTRRLTLLGVVLLLLLSALLSVSTWQNMYAWDGLSQEGSGSAAVAIDRALAEKYAGPLTDAKVREMLADFSIPGDLHGINAKYIYQNALQSAVFARFADINGQWNGLSVADVFGAEPVTVGYVNGWLATSMNLLKLTVSLSLVVIVMIAPVFAGEYGTVDSLLLTCRCGRTKDITAKLLASLFASLLLAALLLAVNLLFALAVYGRAGLQGSILFAPHDYVEGYIPFNLTCGTLLRYQSLLACTCALGTAGVTLLLSAASRSRIAAFPLAAGVHMLPLLLPISETSPLHRLLVLLPLYQAQFIQLVSVAQAKSGALYALLALPVSLLLFLLGAFFARRLFAAHQVS